MRQCVKLSTLFLIILTLTVFNSNRLRAAEMILEDSMADISVVVGTGLGGAVLGLSTLSFVAEPQEHLNNIIIGGALGIIIGVGVVAWMAANKSQQMYQDNARLDLPTPELSRSERVALTRIKPRNFNELGQFFNYNFSF